MKRVVPDGSRLNPDEVLFLPARLSSSTSLRVLRELLYKAFLSHYSRQCD